MMLTGVQNTGFSKDKKQMEITQVTTIQQHYKRIDNVKNSADFDKDTLNKVAKNLGRPGVCILYQNRGSEAGANIPTS